MSCPPRRAAAWLPLLVGVFGLQACGGGGGGDRAPSNPPVTGAPPPPAPPPVPAASLVANGFDSVDKIYLVYHVDDGDGCGRSAWPPPLHRTVSAVDVVAAACAPRHRERGHVNDSSTALIAAVTAGRYNVKT